MALSREGRARFAAKQPEPRPRAEAQQRGASERREPVLAVAEEDEAAVHQPAEEVRHPGRLGGNRPRPGAAEPVKLGGDRVGPRHHLRKVVGHQAKILEPRLDLLGQARELGALGAGDGDVHERFAPLGFAGRREGHEPSGGVARGRKDGMEEGADLEPRRLQGRTDGIDDEGPVGDAGLDDAHRRIPAVGGVGRRDGTDAQLGTGAGVEAVCRGDEAHRLLLGEPVDVPLGAREEQPREGGEVHSIAPGGSTRDQLPQSLGDHAPAGLPSTRLDRHHAAPGRSNARSVVRSSPTR